jgi:hypothetical protein
MKNFKISLPFAFMLCVLIGYFEPANAQTQKDAYVALNSPFSTCPVWSNPLAPGGTITAISFENVTSGLLVSLTDNKEYTPAILTGNGNFPLSTVEGNAYFVPIILVNSDGTPALSTVEGNAYFVPKIPVDPNTGAPETVEGNAYFVPIIKTTDTDPNAVKVAGTYFAPDFDLLTGTQFSIPSYLPDGDYAFVVYTTSGYKFSTKITISAK